MEPTSSTSPTLSTDGVHLPFPFFGVWNADVVESPIDEGETLETKGPGR